MMGAGTRHDDPFLLRESKTEEIDVLVSSQCPRHRLFASGKRGRIEKHHIELFPHLSEPTQFIERIRRTVGAPFLHTVEPGMLPREGQGLFTHVQSLHAACTGKRRLYSECAGMTKHFEHFFFFDESRGREAVLPLIAKPSGLLATRNIDEKPCRAFFHLDCSGPTAPQEPGLGR